MIYLPVSCESCSCMALVASGACLDGRAPCEACGGIVSVLPGCAFPEGDVAIFNALCTVVNDSSLSADDARWLASAVDEAQLAGMDEQAFTNLVRSMPQLRPLQLILDAHPVRRHQALIILATILRGSGHRRESGIIRTDNAERVDTATAGGARRER